MHATWRAGMLFGVFLGSGKVIMQGVMMWFRDARGGHTSNFEWFERYLTAAAYRNLFIDKKARSWRPCL
jgi:hypothetical protein